VSVEPAWLLNDAERQAYALDSRQFMDARQATLPNGVRVVDVYNASGLTYTLLPDRGLDVWAAHYNGTPLTWIAPGSPHPPDWGADWLTQFNGGLLTTCGLTHAGPAEIDAATGEQRGLHGSYTRLSAQDVRIEREGRIMVSATVYETRLAHYHLRVNRRVTSAAGYPEVHIADEITNLGDTPAPLMMLYHINTGFPLIQPGVRWASASRVHPRDADARAGATAWDTYDAPSHGYREQVFFHTMRSDDKLRVANVVIHSRDFGLHVRYRHDALPYLTQWKNTRHGQYVCGIEPGNCIPEGQNAARAAGRLQMIAPGEPREFSVNLRVLPDERAVGVALAAVEKDRANGSPVPSCYLDDYLPLGTP